MRFLGEAFAEKSEDAILREQNAFDNLSSPHHESLILFGTGKCGRKTLAGLRQAGITPLAFCDNNEKLWGTCIDGIKILSPNDAVASFGNKAVFIVTIWNDTSGHPFNVVREQLLSLGHVIVISFLPLYWKYHKLFLPYFLLELPHKVLPHKDEIYEVSRLLHDGELRRCFWSNIQFRLGLECNFQFPAAPSRQHFKFDFFRPNPEEVFIDAGAFTGDTLAGMLSGSDYNFKAILLLEPDPVNYAKLVAYVESLDKKYRDKIKTFPVAATDANAVIYFDASGTDQAQISETGIYPVRGYRLDDLLSDECPTFIKMDIEGAEPQAIHGCSGIIARQAPIFAVSAYHTFDHLWTIPLAIQKLNQEYRFFIRAHAAGGWDTMVYAVPPTRLSSYN